MGLCHVCCTFASGCGGRLTGTEGSPSASDMTSGSQHLTDPPLSPLFSRSRYNRLSPNSLDESSFAHLSKLQVLEVGTGSSERSPQTDVMDGDELMEEEQER